jgi:hypothetical protein
MQKPKQSLVHAIATDPQLWLPVAVLLLGVALLVIVK